MLNIKNTLLGFATPLVMDYSCNGVTAGTKGDGVDRIATTANIVRAAGASAHTWWVLKFPGIHANAEVLFDFNAAPGNGNLCTMSVSTSVGFTGGTTTAAPTASDSQIISANGNNFTAVASDIAIRWSVELSTDLQSMRVALAAIGNVMGIWMLDVPANPVTGWLNPWFSMVHNGPPTVGAGTGGITSMTTYIRSRVNGVNTSITFMCEGPSGNLLPADTNFGNIVNDVSGEWYLAPIGIAGYGTVGARGRHGSVVDAWFGSNSITTGDSYPSTGTTGQFAQFGNLVIPWNNGPVNLS
jgi:hypothetical protein